jgi:uncharacterized peroxidase-related enzyme
MPRSPPVLTGSDDHDANDLLEKTRAQLGKVPNLYASLANAPAALRGYLDFRAALVRGRLSPALRELLALLVADDNGCAYCVAAHTFRGGKMGITPDALAAARRATADDPKNAAALAFARAVVESRGRVKDAHVEAARAAGCTDGEILEIVPHVALNTFSNYVSHVAEPVLDFPT